MFLDDEKQKHLKDFALWTASMDEKFVYFTYTEKDFLKKHNPKLAKLLDENKELATKMQQALETMLRLIKQTA